ncbi:PKD domain-containing protein [Parvicella tangerina]|uniref:PKD domain-containing protein n=1 Tax=Parvicella tangerina TaxID=2829795 RepID=A0A916NQ48_9FLAO|nr:PKD domain-containing protein [Parvicella tangerina]CAG5078280.1 hypothetical protein CRYO30217_00629 [Parvicella tangerina]
MRKAKINTYIIVLFLSVCSALNATHHAQAYEVKMVKVGRGSEQVFATDYHYGELYYCSNAKAKKAKHVVNENNSRFLNLYKIDCKSDFTPEKKSSATMLSSQVNSTLNEGPIFFHKQTGEGFFSSNLKTDSTQLSLAIYKTSFEQESDTYTEREIIPLNLGDGNYSNPTISEDGQTMVFSFTGLTDTTSNLYFTKRTEQGWSQPSPIDGLNTLHNETFPRLCGTTLYFASDRPGGKGGLDIYRCLFSNNKTGEITAMPEPINSAADDFLFFSVSGSAGFFSSNRQNGKDRIFRFQRDLPLPSDFIESNIDFCYTLQDEIILDKNRYDYMWELGDGTKKNGAIIEHCYKDTGVYEVSCHLMDNETLEIEEDIIKGSISVFAEYPVISYQQINDEHLEIFLEQKWSRKSFSEHYWIVNDQTIPDQKIQIPLPLSKPIVIKAVLWNSGESNQVIGLRQTINMAE